MSLEMMNWQQQIDVLYDEFDDLLHENFDFSPTKKMIPYVRDCLAELANLGVERSKIKVRQVKEKFGSLRIYVSMSEDVSTPELGKTISDICRYYERAYAVDKW